MSCHAVNDNDILTTEESSNLIFKIKPEYLQHKLADPKIEYDPETPDLLGTGVLRPDPLSLKPEPFENSTTSYRPPRKHRFSGLRKCSECNLKFWTPISMLEHMEQRHPGVGVSSIFKTRRRKKRSVPETDESTSVSSSMSTVDVQTAAECLLTNSSEQKKLSPEKPDENETSAHNLGDVSAASPQKRTKRAEATSAKVLPERPKRKKMSDVPSRFECEFCGRVFAFRRQIVYHLNSMHSTNDRFKCQYCGRFYGAIASLRDHVQVIHERLMRFKCHVCARGFSRLSRLDRHLHESHNLPLPENETPSERKKRTLAFVQLHSQNAPETDDPSAKLTESTMPKQVNVRRLKPHRHLVPLRRDPRLKCSHCGITFAKIKNRDAHLKRVHADKYPFKCASCAKPFPTVSHLNLHLTFVHREDAEALPFSCNICQQKFVSAWHLRVHQNRTHVETSICSCEWCGQLFATYWLRTKHLQKEHPDAAGPFRCLFCRATFQRAANHRKHMARDHKSEFEKCGVSDVPQFQCPHCSKSYSLAANLRTHINSIHKPPKPLACAHCNKSYDHPSLLHRHVLQIHNVDPTKTPAYSKLANTLSRFTCEHCGQFYTSPTNLGRHLRLVHGAPAKVLTTALFKRTCTLCKRHFSSYSHLRNHIECFHKGDVAFRCHDCDVVFTSAPSLQKHKLQFHEGSVSTDGLPTGQDTFDCELCPSKFACRSHLEDHMRFTHNCRITKTDIGETRKEFVCFPCDICKKLYIGKSALQRHLARVHGTDTSPTLPPPEGVLASMPCHECLQCGRAFQRVRSLHWHMYMKHNAAVANLRCQECPHCDRVFLRSPYLKRHVEKKHKDMATKAETEGKRNSFVSLFCDLCTKPYSGLSALRRHRAKAHNSNTETSSSPPPAPQSQEEVVESMPSHECSHCGRTFRSFRFFQKHMNSEHNGSIFETAVQPTTAPNSSDAF
uniref:Zinc finger protein 99 n=2 Tax=Schistocephalus solidus TaxID=70667 RepID=A0A0X3PNW5_SCHSO